VVAQSLRRAETLVLYSGSCVAPLRLGGRRGKQSTHRVWLGGTGEPSGSASGSGKESGHGTKRRTSPKRASGQGMILILAKLCRNG
jgi:hypothetical protein